MSATPLETARTLLTADFERFECVLAQALELQSEYLTETEYELYRRGKRLRPILLLLCARMINPDAEIPTKVIRAAVSLEMLHVATLIHDDIVDDADTRRGLKTVYAERGNNLAILVGDMQFVQAVRCFADGIDTQKDMNLVRLVLDVGYHICAGEIDELQTDPNWNHSALLHRYNRTIDRKTGMLFGLACESGVALMNGHTRQTYTASRFGRRFGRAFQIMDDLIDLMVSKETAGKNPGSDIRQGRLSLPIIYALNELPGDHILQRMVRKQEPATPENVYQAVQAIILSEAFFKTYSAAREAIVESLEYLHQLPENAYRDSLCGIAEYVVNRDLNTPTLDIR